MLYEIALPIVPLPPDASPPSPLSDSSFSLEDVTDRVEHSGSVEIQQRPDLICEFMLPFLILMIRSFDFVGGCDCLD